MVWRLFRAKEETRMSEGEMLYLGLVVVAFGAFAVVLAFESMRQK